MQYRPLGRTGIEVSALSFGAGPVSTLMVGEDRQRQRAVLARALEAGINWIDTAATYGNGQSERSLGLQLRELGAAAQFHIATKVRLMPDDLGQIREAVQQSVAGSLERLQVPRVSLLQLHNSITPQRGDEPTSITPEDVLGTNGVLAAFRELQEEGLALHVGLTGIGNPDSLRQVIRSGEFATMQVPFHMLNPSAGQSMDDSFGDTNYGNIIQDCGEMAMGVFAIRVLAGGALAGNEPSPHTLKTPFFPLDLYERDRARAKQLADSLGPDRDLPTQAIRFVLAHRHISSAIIGFGEPWQIDQAIAALD